MAYAMGHILKSQNQVNHCDISTLRQRPNRLVHFDIAMLRLNSPNLASNGFDGAK
jgi:hypothetical protein